MIMKEKIWSIFLFSSILLSCSVPKEKVAEKSPSISYAELKSNFQNPHNQSGLTARGGGSTEM